jgi:hypothetical protein
MAALAQGPPFAHLALVLDQGRCVELRILSPPLPSCWLGKRARARTVPAALKAL